MHPAELEALPGPEGAEVQDVLTRFFRAFLAGRSADLAYFVPAERRRLFAAAMAVILAGAGALALLAGPAPRPQRAPKVPLPVPPVVVLPADDALSLQAPSEEGAPRKDLEGAAADVVSVKRAARRFLPGYLAYMRFTLRCHCVKVRTGFRVPV